MVIEHAQENCPHLGVADDWGDRPRGCTGALTQACSCGRTVFVRWLTHGEWMGDKSDSAPTQTPSHQMATKVTVDDANMLRGIAVYLRAVTSQKADLPEALEGLAQRIDSVGASSASALTPTQIDAILDRLFINGQGERADRLVLAQDLATPAPKYKDLGGWSRAAVRLILEMIAVEGAP